MKQPLIFFLLIGIINVFLTAGCGKDNRVVLHSESEDILVVKFDSDKVFPNSGIEEKLDKSKLATALVSRVDSVSKVYNISDQLEENWIHDKWYIIFSVGTDEGVFNGVKCHAGIGTEAVRTGFWDKTKKRVLFLLNCGSGSVEFHNKEISIPLSEIIYKKEGLS